MRANLNDLLPRAAASDYAVPCFNVFGYEDARAVTNVAEKLGLPVILAANKNFVEYMHVSLIGALLNKIAETASVPVCVHLDHCMDEQIIRQAIDSGFASVMFDGSQLPLAENIAHTRKVVELAHANGISIEGEIGSVSYHTGNSHIRHELTDPEEALIFSRDSGVDAVAVSIGNVHRLEKPGCDIYFDRLEAIAQVVKQPLVLHGVTGVKDDDLRKLALTRIAKCNVGTSLRMTFGESLRRLMQEYPNEFDRLFFFNRIMPDLESCVDSIMRLLAPSDYRYQTSGNDNERTQKIAGI